MKHPDRTQPRQSTAKRQSGRWQSTATHKAQAKQRRKDTADQQRESKQTQSIAKAEAELKARGSQAQPKTGKTIKAQSKHCWQKARKTKQKHRVRQHKHEAPREQPRQSTARRHLEHQQGIATHRAQVKQSRSSKGKASIPKAQPKQGDRSWQKMAKQN